MIPCQVIVLRTDDQINAMLNSLLDSPARAVFEQKWTEFARRLNLSGNAIEELTKLANRKNWGTSDIFNGIVSRWILLKGENAKVTTFLDALEKCELNDVAHRIKSALQNVETQQSNAREEDVHQSTSRQLSTTPDLLRRSTNEETNVEVNSESFEMETPEDENTNLLPISIDSTTESRETNVSSQNTSCTSNTQGLNINDQSTTIIDQPNTSNCNCIDVEGVTNKSANWICISLGFIVMLIALYFGYKVITKQNKVEQIMLPCKDISPSFNNCYITKITNYSHYYDTAKISPKSCESLYFQLEDTKDWPLSSTVYNPSCVYSIVLQGYYSRKMIESIIKQTSNVIYLKINSDNEEFCRNYAQNNISNASENITLPLSHLKSISFNVTCQDNQIFPCFTDYLGSNNLREIIVYNYAAVRGLLLVLENVLVDSDMNAVVLDENFLLVTKDQNTSRHESYFNSNTFSGWTDSSKKVKIGKDFCSRFKSLETFIISDRFFRFNDRFYVFKCTELRQLYLKLYIEPEEISDLKIKLLKHLDIVFIYLHFPNCPSDEQTRLLKIKDINASYRYFVKSNCIIDHDKEIYSIDMLQPSLSSR